MENGRGPVPSVMECGGPDTPLSPHAKSLVPHQSDRGLAQSKTWRDVVVSLVLFSITLGACAQNYSIDWFKVAGGGGTSTNGQYAISGTIGQPDACAAMSGGVYSLSGGFWSLLTAVQTSGAPLLSVTRLGNSVIVSWPHPSSGFLLQQNYDLNSTNWTISGYAISTNAAVNSITILSPAGNTFFRLYKP
jgi:hypothetical protein